jgi:O-antigen/teichoic acid export membrane protein
LNWSKNYLLNLLTTFLSQACSAGLIIFLVPTLQQNFSIAEFSNYGVLLNIILFTAAFDFGLNLGLMRRLIHETEKASIFISSTFFCFLGLFLMAIPLFFACFYWNLFHTGNSYLINAFLVSILVLQTIVAALFDVILQSNHKIFVGKLIRIGKTIIEFVVLYVLSVQASASILLFASTIINTVFILVLYIYSQKSVNYSIAIKYFSWHALLDHMRYSFWYFLNSIGVVFVFNSQIILLNSFATKAEVANYILVTRFFDVVRMGTTNFTVILFPSIAQKEANGEWNTLQKTYYRVLTSVILLCVFILIFLLSLGKWIFQYWSGQTNQPIMQLFTLLSVFTVLIVIDNVSAVFLHALRLNKMQTIISIMQGCIAMVLGYFLLNKMGVIGFAFASIAALLLTNFFYNPFFLMKQLKQRVLNSF